MRLEYKALDAASSRALLCMIYYSHHEIDSEWLLSNCYQLMMAFHVAIDDCARVW